MGMTDIELIAASRRGDASAFGQIVERYQRAVCAVSYSGTGDRALSEDVAQDTFVTAWRQLAALREIERLPAWLCGIARNLGCRVVGIAGTSAKCGYLESVLALRAQ